MDTSISEIIAGLQKSGTVTPGEYRSERKEHPFSIIHRVTIGVNVFYFKQLKTRVNNSNQDLINRLVSEYDALVKISAIVKDEKDYNIPEPVYFSEKDLLLVTKELKGETVLDVGRRYACRKSNKDDNALDVFYNTGRFLKILHQVEVCPFTYDDLKTQINYITKRLITDNFNAKEKQKITNYLKNAEQAIAKQLFKYHKNAIHRDYSPGNILSYNNVINVLDFGDFTIGSYYEDLIAFKAMVERQLENRVKYNKDAVIELIKAFGKGYDIDIYQVNDPLYDLYNLTCYSVFIATFQKGKVWQLAYQTKVSLKDIVLNSYEYYKFKRNILRICDK